MKELIKVTTNNEGKQLVSAIDLDGDAIELATELTYLFEALDIDCEVVEID